MGDSNPPNQNPGPCEEEESENEFDKLTIRLAANISFPMVLKSVMELNILDVIEEAGPGAFISASQISAKLPNENPHAPTLLDRMLTLLSSHSILRCSIETQEDGEAHQLYGLAPLSKFFLKKQEGIYTGSLLLLIYDKIFMESWYHLNDAILKGGVPFDRIYGKSAFEYLGTDSRFNHVFNQALSDLTTWVMKKILHVYKGFEDVKVLVDVGGGIGANLNLIISKYPNIKGINYDLPHVIATAPPYTGVEHEGGDMFASVPHGDAIFMKAILHNWSDNHCLKLLKNCYEALPNCGKVIIVELIRPETPESTDTAQYVYSLDVFMLTQHHGGKERTQKEFEALAMKSGFSSAEVICSANYYSVVEFYKKDST